jgi:hypothetical protein
MLRGPQTLGELRTNSHRLYEFDDLDDVDYVLQRMAEQEPPLVVALPRQPGQKEGRFAHLLAGEPDLTAFRAPSTRLPQADGLAERVEALETAVQALREDIESLRNG